jgi:hypothetical protein
MYLIRMRRQQQETHVQINHNAHELTEKQHIDNTAIGN